LIRNEDKRFSSKLKLITGVLGLIITIIALYSLNENIRDIIDFSINKIFNIRSDLQKERMGSTRLRLLGHVYLFDNLPMFFKIVGLGANQYVKYFNLIISYSSTVVTILLNYGIVGVLAFFFWIYKVFKKQKKNRIYLLIFIMISFAVGQGNKSIQ